MTDDVKAAWERALDRHWRFCHAECSECEDFETVDAHLDGEAARTAAAVAAAREEQREACAQNFPKSAGESLADPWAAELVRATPLTAKPLADRIAELEAERDALRDGVEHCELELHSAGFSIDDGLATAIGDVIVERDALRAQVEAARTYARQALDYGEDCDATDLLAAMDEAKP